MPLPYTIKNQRKFGRRNFRVTDMYDGQEWMEWNGTERNGMDWSGMKWIGMEWNVLYWNGMECIGLEWNGIYWSGLGWYGLDWNGMMDGMEWNDMAWHKSFQFQNLKEVSHKSFVFTSSAFRFWGRSRTKALFSHLQLSDFEGGLARKLRFHIFNFQTLKEVSHESFVFTSSTFNFWGRSRTKASFSHLQLSLFEGRSLARNAFLKVSGCTNCRVLQDETCLGRWMGKLVRRAVAEHARLNRDHSRIGPALALKV